MGTRRTAGLREAGRRRLVCGRGQASESALPEVGGVRFAPRGPLPVRASGIIQWARDPNGERRTAGSCPEGRAARMKQYLYEIRVLAAAMDDNGHANNVEYVRWMQEAALSHSDAAGCAAATQADGAAWVVRSHRIEYLRPVYTGDVLEIRTWVTGVRRTAALRYYEFVRRPDGQVVARGETEWVYLDLARGRPRGVPHQIRALFGAEVGANGAEDT